MAYFTDESYKSARKSLELLVEQQERQSTEGMSATCNSSQARRDVETEESNVKQETIRYWAKNVFKRRGRSTTAASLKFSTRYTLLATP
jgi:hypothetical protein